MIVILQSLSCCIWMHVSTSSRHLKEALSLHKSIMLSMAWEIGLGLGPPPVFPCSCLWFVNTFVASFFQIVPFFFDFIWDPNGHSQWAGLLSYLSPYFLYARVIGYGGRPHRFPHNNFSSVYWIFTELGHMIPLWKGKNPIYFGVIRSKVKVTITINIFFDNRVVSTW